MQSSIYCKKTWRFHGIEAGGGRGYHRQCERSKEKELVMDCNVFLHEASTILGLEENEIKDARQSIIERKIVIVQDDFLTVDQKRKLQVTNHFVNRFLNAAPGIAYVSTLNVVTENKHVEMQTCCPSELASPLLS